MARRTVAIARHELKVLRRDPGTLIFVLLMPLVLAALMQQMYRATLVQDGWPDATGAEVAVPGMAVSFAAFGASYVGFAFFRDHDWSTWDRLRATPAPPAAIIAGKVLPGVALSTLQMTTLLVVAVPVFGFEISGSWAALALLVIALACCLNAITVALVAVTRSAQQFNAISGVVGLVLATVGGAFVPIALLPQWAQSVAPLLPTSWAVEGMQDVVLRGAGTAQVAGQVAALLGAAAALAGLAAATLRMQDAKTL